MGSLLVVVGDERVELVLQLGERGRGVMRGEPLLERLLEPFNFPAGLWVIRPGVPDADTERSEVFGERGTEVACRCR